MTRTRIRILRDEVSRRDPSGPVAAGTIVEETYFPSDEEFLCEQGEVWYQRPDTGEDWFSLPGDFEVIK